MIVDWTDDAVAVTPPAVDATGVPAPERAGRSAADIDAVAVHGVAEHVMTGSVLVEHAVSTPPPPVITAATLDEIEEALRDVVDPELGVNVVDLGLIYDLNVGDDQVLTIDMTLTSAACPLTDMIEDQVGAALMGDDQLVADYKINWVWLPPWGPEKITDDGREQLRALGFNV